MSRLIIIGASALGREVFTYAQESGLEVKGFLDSRENILDCYSGYPPILGNVESWRPSNDEIYICACGSPDVKFRYSNMLKNVKWGRIVHPTAYIGSNVYIGEGSIISPYATIGNDTKVGKHVLIRPHVHVAHDCRIGDYVSVSPSCTIGGWCVMSDGVFMGIQSLLVPHVNLGDSVIVAAGAVVTKSFESGLLMGVPAKTK